MSALSTSSTRFAVVAIVVLAAAVLAAACSDESSTPTGSPVGPEAGSSVQQPLPRQLLTRYLALALRDSEVRQVLYFDMQSSPVKEGKLHFRTYLAGAGDALVGAMTQAAGNDPTAISELLEEAIDLELYLPVPEHRQAWRGGSDLLVATQRDEDETPYGVDLGGRAVILSAAEPPSTPTLVLVPAESFDANGRPHPSAVRSPPPPSRSESCDDPTSVESCGETGGGGIDWSTKAAGLWLTSAYLSDLGESWTKGEPELEVFAARRDPTSEFDEGQFIRCVAESKSGDSRYVQNDNDYGGIVLIATQAQLDATPSGQGLMFIVYEDDDATCDIRDETDALENSIAAVKAFQDGLDGLRDEDSGTLGKIVTALESVIQLITNTSSVIKTNDDLIGEVVQRSCSLDGRTGNYQVRRDTGLKGCATVKAN